LLDELYRLGFRRFAVPVARRDEKRFVLGRQQESEIAVVSQALGFIETIGLVAAIQAADAMAKAANIKLVTRQQPGGGLISIMVQADVGAVKAAVDAGAAAAGQIGKVVSAHIIPRPHEEMGDLLERPPVR